MCGRVVWQSEQQSSHLVANNMLGYIGMHNTDFSQWIQSYRTNQMSSMVARLIIDDRWIWGERERTISRIALGEIQKRISNRELSEDNGIDPEIDLLHPKSTTRCNRSVQLSARYSWFALHLVGFQMLPEESAIQR